ncbi:MAG: hypothetical protein M0R74_04160 [Dehalococcoidia bacterium]|nr:hypothetical protein [Dehalococcoidia bacterium]
MVRRKDTNPRKAGLANQVARNASLGEAWTQAKSTKPVPDGHPAQFAEFQDEMPHSRNQAESGGDDTIPEHAEPPSLSGGAKSQKRPRGEPGSG